MRMNNFAGLVTAASPYRLPPGAAVKQVNITSLSPGQLTVRGGIQTVADLPERALEAWSYLIGSGQNDLVLFYGSTGKLYVLRGIGSTTQVDELFAGMLADTPTSFAQGRRNEVYVFQGHGQRPITINSNLVARLIGMDPPDKAPVATLIPGVSGYVARVDILDPGFGYVDAPKITISAPTGPKGRQATAITRIADQSVNVIQVTDGGQDYEKAPSVTIEGPDDGASFTHGSGALLTLEPEFAKGDHNEGVVYWEPYLDGSPLGVFQTSDDGRTEHGYTFCLNEPTAPDGTPGWKAEYWRGGWIFPTCTSGSGTGAKMWVPMTQLGRRTLSYITPHDPNDPNNPALIPNPCGEQISAICEMPDGYDEKMIYGMSSDIGDYFGMPQIYDFGTGYKPGDEVYAYIHTTTFYRYRTSSNNPLSGYIYIANCLSGGGCPYVFKGYIYGDKSTPPNVTIKAASPMRQQPLAKKPIVNPGTGYSMPPDFLTDDLKIIKSEIDPNTGGVIKLLPEIENETYLWAPEVIDIVPETATAKGQAIMRPNLRGQYRLYVRYVNDTVPKSDGGPLYSSLSPALDIDVGESAKGFEWKLPDKLPDHATGIELFRTTSNQKTTVFRIARLGGTSDISLPYDTKFTDMFSDWDLTDSKRADFLAVPVVLDDGSLNANRYGIPSGDFAVGVMFQDRLFLGVDTTGKRPNTLMYSEADEPESMPEINELILQTNLRDTDYLTALVPYAAALVVFQSKACHRLTYVDNPQTDANVSLLAYRGCLNQRCWDMHEGVLYVMDDLGVYAMTESGQVTAISQAIDDIFRTNTDADHPRIDMSKRQWFFLRTDRNQKVIRVFVTFVGEDADYPTTQLCYSVETKSWWMEEYPTLFTAGTDCRLSTGEIISLCGDSESFQRLAYGLTDNGDSIPFSWQSGNCEFITDDTRGGDQSNPRNVSVTYEPTQGSSTLNMSLRYNGSPTPRANLVDRDRGVGFIAHEGVPESTIDMQRIRGERGESPAIASALFANRTLRDIYGNDRCVSVELHGEQSDAGQVALHEVEVQGVVEKQ